MKKLMSLVLAVLLMVAPLTGLGEESGSVFDRLWALEDWSFLVELGVLTQEEAARLSVDRMAVEAGRELVRTGSIATGALMGVPEVDETLAALMARASFGMRQWRDGVELTLLADGEVVESLALGVQEEMLVVRSHLLPAPLGVTAEELRQTGTFTRLTSALMANGLMDQDEGRAINMLLLTGGVSPWYVGVLEGFMADAPDLSGLDLSAWNAVLEDITGRMAYADGADGTRSWTLEVTAADLKELIVAGLIVLRDNAELNAILAEAVGMNAYSGAGDVSFNDAFILPLLAELEGAETLMPIHTRLAGQEDAEGNLVRLEIDLCDAENPALPAELRFDWSCRQEADGEVYELLMGDETGMYIYVSCTHAIGAFGDGYMLSLGSIEEDGRYVALSAELGWRVSRSSYTLFTQAEVYLDVTFPGNEFMSTPPESLHYQLMLEIAEHRIAIIAVSERESAYVPLRSEFVVRAAIDGVDLTGTESFTVTCGTEMMLDYRAEITTVPHEDAPFAENVLRMGAMSNAELNAFVGQVKESALAWYGAQQEGWLGELEQFLDSLEPEEEPNVEVGMSVVLWTIPAPDDRWTVEIVEGEDVVQVRPFTGNLTVGETPMEEPYLLLEVAALQAGEATVRVATYGDEELLEPNRIMTLRLGVDEMGTIETLDRAVWAAEDDLAE